MGASGQPAPELELIADERCIVGEGPLWHAAEKRLYWGDIVGGKLFRYDPAAGSYEQIYQGEMVGGFTIQADGALLLFGERGSVRTWRDGVIETVIDEIPEERGGRFNDVIADPEGRVFCGTMPIGDQLGRLYRLDPDGTLTPVLDGINISNGMGFTPDLAQMYHTDTFGGTITVFDYDRATGALSNGKVLVTVPPEEGLPGRHDGRRRGLHLVGPLGRRCPLPLLPRRRKGPQGRLSGPQGLQHHLRRRRLRRRLRHHRRRRQP